MMESCRKEQLILPTNQKRKKYYDLDHYNSFYFEILNAKCVFYVTLKDDENYKDTF